MGEPQRRRFSLEERIAIRQRNAAILRRILGRQEAKAARAREEHTPMTDWFWRELAFYRDKLARKERQLFDLKEKLRAQKGSSR